MTITITAFEIIEPDNPRAKDRLPLVEDRVRAR